MVACGRCCCICHRFKGTKLELHHIALKSEGGTDSFENAIPLCFDCHAEQSSYDAKHPKGTKYQRGELLIHRDNWYARAASTNSEIQNVELDRQVITLIKQLLPSRGVVHFLRKHDFAGGFYLSSINPIKEFSQMQLDPEFEFLNSDLEQMLRECFVQIDVFLEKIAVNTFEVHERNSDWRRVPSDWRRVPRDWDPIVSADVSKQINAAATKLVESYDTLVRNSRRILVIRV